VMDTHETMRQTLQGAKAPCCVPGPRLRMTLGNTTFPHGFRWHDAGVECTLSLLRKDRCRRLTSRLCFEEGGHATIQWVRGTLSSLRKDQMVPVRHIASARFSRCCTRSSRSCTGDGFWKGVYKGRQPEPNPCSFRLQGRCCTHTKVQECYDNGSNVRCQLCIDMCRVRVQKVPRAADQSHTDSNA